jgi:hypothetical protein
LFFFVLCILSCQSLWIVLFWLPLLYSLTFNYLFDDLGYQWFVHFPLDLYTWLFISIIKRQALNENYCWFLRWCYIKLYRVYKVQYNIKSGNRSIWYFGDDRPVHKLSWTICYTPHNKVVGGYTGFTMSICLSVRPSVCRQILCRMITWVVFLRIF